MFMYVIHNKIFIGHFGAYLNGCKNLLVMSPIVFIAEYCSFQSELNMVTNKLKKINMIVDKS